jgi:hypothetical protein
MIKESNIIFFLIHRQLGTLNKYFKNKIVILSRPNYDEDYLD